MRQLVTRLVQSTVRGLEVNECWVPLLLLPQAGVPPAFGVGLSSVKPFCKHPHRLNAINVAHEDNHHARSAKVRILERRREMNVEEQSRCHF